MTHAEMYAAWLDAGLVHCLGGDCLRGSPAGNRETALRDPRTFTRAGCECRCWLCEAARARGPDVAPYWQMF